MNSERIIWGKPWVTLDEKKNINELFEAGWFTNGPKVKEFEEKMADLLQSKYAVAVSNGTIALDIALDTIGITKGDKILLPAFSYISTIFAVLRKGAVPIFVDIELSTFNLCPIDLQSKVSKDCKLIIYIDYGGMPAQFEMIREIGDKYEIPILQDAAQTLGAKKNNKFLGYEGDISTTSFHAAKLITTIEGGMIFTNCQKQYNKIRCLRNQGEEDIKYYHTEIGYNARMTDIQASFGLSQLNKFDEILEKRKQISSNYRTIINDLNLIAQLPVIENERTIYSNFFFPILIENRDEVYNELINNNIDIRIAYPIPLYRQPAVKKRINYSEMHICKNTEYVSARIINLPMFHEMEYSQQEFVIRTIRNAQKKFF